MEKRNGPYAPNTAGLGALPNIGTDVPICSVFIVLYAFFAIRNIIIFRKNGHNRHKFLISVFLIGFSWARVGTLVLRIAWANRQHNVRLALAATIFLNVGVLILYIVNLILAQRILRAMQPQFGWHAFVRAGFKALYLLIALALLGVVSSVVITAYTLNEHTRLVCRDVQLAALTFLFVITCLPGIVLILAVFLSRSEREEYFGTGSMRSKMIVVALTTCCCVTIAGFKTGVNWSPPRPTSNPAWYDSKACLYTFDFTMGILTLSILTFSRIDQRFFVPNGCRQPGDYTRLQHAQRVEKEDVDKLHKVTRAEST